MPPQSPTPQAPPPQPLGPSPGTSVSPSPGPENPTPGLAPQPQVYDFITETPKEPMLSPLSRLPGQNSTIGRAAYIFGVLFVVLIGFIFIKGLLSRNPGLDVFVSIAQDQQELIHLSTNAASQPGLNVTNQNFAVTTEASVTSSQGAIIKYIVGSGRKLETKTLDLKLSASTDAQLKNAIAAATYDQTFQSVMNIKLTSYANDLNQAFNGTTNPNNRVAFKNDYKQAQLMLTQLNTPIE